MVLELGNGNHANHRLLLALVYIVLTGQGKVMHTYILPSSGLMFLIIYRESHSAGLLLFSSYYRFMLQH